jgi:hypothetical protein
MLHQMRQYVDDRLIVNVSQVTFFLVASLLRGRPAAGDWSGAGLPASTLRGGPPSLRAPPASRSPASLRGRPAAGDWSYRSGPSKVVGSGQMTR